MKSTGIVRNIDNLGRIVIPKELRDSMDIHKQDEVEIFVDNNEIIIKKFRETCIFCESTENIIEFKNQNICKKCLTNIIKTEEKIEESDKVDNVDKVDKVDEVNEIDEDGVKEKGEDEVNEVRDDSHSQKDDSFFDKIINFFKKD